MKIRARVSAREVGPYETVEALQRKMTGWSEFTPVGNITLTERFTVGNRGWTATVTLEKELT